MRALIEAERNLPEGFTDDDVDLASTRTIEALDALATIPAPSASDAFAKVAAICTIHDAHGVEYLDAALAELGAFIASPACLPKLATPPGSTPFRIAHNRYLEARATFDGTPGNETDPVWAAASREWDEAADAMDAMAPTSWVEFGEAFLIATLDGESYLTDANHEKLAGDARRLRDQETALPAAPATIPSGFASNRVAVESARKALDEYREGTFYPAEIIPGYVPEEIEVKERELDAAYWAALEAALAHPCHSVTELLDKLKVVAAADAWELAPAQNGLEADLERITGGQA